MVEGWHDAFAGTLDTVHANSGCFINALKGAQTLVETYLSQERHGRRLPVKRRRRYLDYKEIIKAIVQDYAETDDMLHYL